jgi:hypothetical protein
MHAHPTLLHPIVVVGPFTKYGIDFMMGLPASATGHNYIIVAIDYFTKWTEEIPRYSNEEMRNEESSSNE